MEKITAAEIDRRIEKGEDLSDLYANTALNYESLKKAIHKGANLQDLYIHQTLYPEHIDYALRKGVSLGVLFRQQNLLPEQKDYVFEHMDDDDALIDLVVNTDLIPEQITRVIETKNDELVKAIYKYQKLDSKQIGVAMKKGVELSTLFKYQRMPSRYIERAIEEGVNLEQYLHSGDITRNQKMKILKKLNIDLPYELFDSDIWKDVREDKLGWAIEQYVEAIKDKMKESPLKRLVGTYETAILSSELIEKFLVEKEMTLKEGDFKYAYYVDKDGAERKMKVGRLLRDDPALVKMHMTLMQSGKPDPDVEIVISIDPEDIAGKGMNLEKETCEAIGGPYGIGSSCGWCDDIKANNLIGYIKKKKEKGKWIGRCMIRWCIRKDTGKSDAVLELYYGKPRYRDMLVNNLVHILREKGFSACGGDISCTTPYTYSGFVDIGTHTNGIEYKVGVRDKKK